MFVIIVNTGIVFVVIMIVRSVCKGVIGMLALIHSLSFYDMLSPSSFRMSLWPCGSVMVLAVLSAVSHRTRSFDFFYKMRS